MRCGDVRILQIPELADRFSYFVNCGPFDVLASYCCFSKLRKVRKHPTENCRKSIFDKCSEPGKLLRNRGLLAKPRFITILSPVFSIVSDFS